MEMYQICTLVLLIVSSIAAQDGLQLSQQTSPTFDVLVSMKEGTGAVLAQVSSRKYASRGERITDLYNALVQNAQTSQQEVLHALESAPLAAATTTKSFWITNQIYIQGATSELIQYLRTFPQISSIEEDEVVRITDQVNTSVQHGLHRNGSTLAEWGINIIQAPEAWVLPGGNDGQGIIVANIDSGVRSTHVTLSSSFKNDAYSWYDPYSKTPVPIDDHGHGTHTMGTIVGGQGIGVAPGAKWIACKGLKADNSGTGAALIECGQFVTCPTHVDGSNPDCTAAPHLVSNSWGSSTQGNPWYNGVINAWKAAGIIPIFANMNEGPECGTGRSPADQDVIAVGATTSSDALASFSGRGPSVYGVIKPLISAPGNLVRSASNSGDDSYQLMSGTSMATPHVAGVVALMLSRDSTLSYAEVKTLLTGTVDANLLFAGDTCGGIPDSEFPNNHFGYGRLNALKVMQAVIGKKHEGLRV